MKYHTLCTSKIEKKKQRMQKVQEENEQRSRKKKLKQGSNLYYQLPT